MSRYIGKDFYLLVLLTVTRGGGVNSDSDQVVF